MVTSDELLDLLAVNTKTCFLDNFDSHDHLTGATTGSGEVVYEKNNIALNTQLIANSTVRLNYTTESFNPLYSRLLIKMEMNTMDDVFAYWGFSGDLEAPTWHMDKSHAGYMLYQGTLYAITGDNETPSPHYRVTTIADVDTSRELIFEIKSYDFRWYSIPVVEAYFDQMIEPKLAASRFRKWSGTYSNATVRPQNTVHYIYFFIKNLTNYNRYIRIKSIAYREDYSD